MKANIRKLLYYTLTGHSRYGIEGDKFTSKQNIISLGKTVLKSWRTWKYSYKHARRQESCVCSFPEWFGFFRLGLVIIGVLLKMVSPQVISLNAEELDSEFEFDCIIKRANKL